MYDDIHREEAQATDHDASFQELANVGPPCKECRTQEAIDGRGKCSDCLPDDADD